MEHFNRSLSGTQKWRQNRKVKTKIALMIRFTMTNGGKRTQGNALIIRRTDINRIHDYARQNCCLRDYLLIRVPMKIGLRTGEICRLCIENIDFDKRSFTVTDSKNKQVYPLPLDTITLQLIHDLVTTRTQGYVFNREVYSRSWSHKHQGEPLTVALVWFTVKHIAEKVGVENFSPRLLRHFFAAEWHSKGKSLELLRQILRHKSLAYTQIYLSRLTFFEDIQQAYEETQEPYVNRDSQNKAPDQTSQCCQDCPNVAVCKYADKMPNFATGCSFKEQTKNVKLNPHKHRFS